MKGGAVRRFALALAALIFGVLAAFSPALAPTAQAATTCKSTRTANPQFYNLSVADGQWNNIRVKYIDKVYGTTGETTITEGTSRYLCVTSDYVPLGKDVMLRCGNGWWVVQAATGWHSLTWGTNGSEGYCKSDVFGGPSFVVSFEIRPNGYWN